MRLDGRTCQQTLAWVNEIRKAQGRDPLDELPMGIRTSVASCPVARATGLLTYDGSNAELDLTVAPAYVRRFVDAFDCGRIPELEEARIPELIA